MKKILCLLALACCATATNPVDAFQETSAEEKKDTPAFGIGSEAPSIEISNWVSNGDGKFEEITDFKSGNVYVVEFWATWCPPCIAAMPHISELQTKFEDKGVQIISVSDESLAKVEKFLEKKVRGKDDETYGELTANYCLTCDKDRSVHTSYLRAAGETGIPTAFIVGKTGEIEWIGHPKQT